MKKTTMIKKIKSIITQTGPLCSGELELDCDVCYGNLGENVVALIETYNTETVGVAVYAHDNCVDEFDSYYEDLSDDQLLEILGNILNYEAEEE